MNGTPSFYYLIDLHYSQTLNIMSDLTERFYYLIDLHYSQTSGKAPSCRQEFYYLIDLHYSQTEVVCSFRTISFTTLQIYTILKPTLETLSFGYCFTTLQIYTILKLLMISIESCFRFTTLQIYTILKPQIGNKMHPLYCTRQIYKDIL